MFKKLFGSNREDQDEYVDRVADMVRTIQSDISEDDKRRIVTNMDEDIREDYD